MADIEKSSLNEETIQFLNTELNNLMTLYNAAQNSIQGVFNFYLTFVSAIIGLVVLLIQLGSDGVSYGLLAVLLFFAVIVGSLYLTALSGRYARASRYAYGVDEIRRFLAREQQLKLPAVYDDFLNPKDRRATGKYALTYWLMPTGSYQMFMVLTNSTALATMLLILTIGNNIALQNGLVLAGIVFVLTMFIYNFYSRLVIKRFEKRINVYHRDDSPAWSAQE